MSDHSDQVRLLFDSKARRWPDKYAPEGRLTGRLTRFSGTVRDLVAPGGELLDLGCGSGELARQLAADGYVVTGCDIASEMLHHAQAADAAGTVRWVRLDARWRTLPFGGGVLDAVIASSVLEYVPDPAAVLRECSRVLRPGGVLVCSVPDVAHPVRWLEWPLGLAARVPLASAAQGGWPWLGSYLAYLRVSRRRRRVHWWQAVARRAGLRPVPPPGGPARRGPLRLLAFTRTADEMTPARQEGSQ